MIYLNNAFIKLDNFIDAQRRNFLFNPATNAGWIRGYDRDPSFGKHFVVALFQLSSIPIELANGVGKLVQVIANVVAAVAYICLFEFGKAYNVLCNAVLNLREVIASPIMVVPGVRLFLMSKMTNSEINSIVPHEEINSNKSIINNSIEILKDLIKDEEKIIESYKDIVSGSVKDARKLETESHHYLRKISKDL